MGSTFHWHSERTLPFPGKKREKNCGRTDSHLGHCQWVQHHHQAVQIVPNGMLVYPIQRGAGHAEQEAGDLLKLPAQSKADLEPKRSCGVDRGGAGELAVVVILAVVQRRSGKAMPVGTVSVVVISHGE